MNEIIFLGIIIWLFVSSLTGVIVTFILEIFDLQDLIDTYCDLFKRANILGYIIIFIITLFFLPPLLIIVIFVLLYTTITLIIEGINIIAFNKDKE